MFSVSFKLQEQSSTSTTTAALHRNHTYAVQLPAPTHRPQHKSWGSNQLTAYLPTIPSPTTGMSLVLAAQLSPAESSRGLPFQIHVTPQNAPAPQNQPMTLVGKQSTALMHIQATGSSPDICFAKPSATAANALCAHQGHCRCGWLHHTQLRQLNRAVQSPPQKEEVGWMQLFAAYMQPNAVGVADTCMGFITCQLGTAADITCVRSYLLHQLQRTISPVTAPVLLYAAPHPVFGHHTHPSTIHPMHTLNQLRDASRQQQRQSKTPWRNPTISRGDHCTGRLALKPGFKPGNTFHCQSVSNQGLSKATTPSR